MQLSFYKNTGMKLQSIINKLIENVVFKTFLIALTTSAISAFLIILGIVWLCVEVIERIFIYIFI